MNTIDNQKVGKQYPTKIETVHQNGGIFTFETSDATLRLEVISDKIIRFRFSTMGLFERDFSYAIDSNFDKQEVSPLLVDEEAQYIIKTPMISCLLNKTNLLITIVDQNNKVILEDETGFHWEEHPEFGGNYVFNSKKIQIDEHFYGLGDKPTDLNLKTRRFVNWCSDTYGFERDQDPIYRSIPFYLGLHAEAAYGVFFDNTFRSYFDFGLEDDDTLSFWAEGGEMNYYFIYGPDLLKVTSQYTLLTGVPELPPLWALGFQQCKWSYYPEAKVREIANEFRSRKIPCDAIYLDIDYMDGFRCFTWNNTHFPAPKQMISELKDQGFKTVCIIDPGIKVDKNYSIWKDGFEKGMFCKRTDGPLMTGNVWPGECNFPDFTNPKVREWWSLLFGGLLADGVAGIWNDMNEPAVFGLGTFPLDVRHDYDGDPCSHRKAHNIYGMQMARATRQGLKHFRPNERPFLITRASYAGFQKYASVWTGDNIATWEHLWIASVQCQRLSVSGVSFCGSDIGGFIGEPDGELFTRWIQLSMFHPFFRAHSSGDNGEKEPWVFGQETEEIVKKFIELRYQLIPYLYSAFWQYITRGTPIIRPLVFLDQNDPDTWHRQDEFAVGDHILTCPVTVQGAIGRWLYLPAGVWYNFWTDEPYNGGVEIWADAPIESTPIFIKSGAVVPNYPVQQFIGEVEIKEITLHIYYTDLSTKSELYQDGGEGFEYKNNGFVIYTFNTRGNHEHFEITCKTEGHFQPTCKDFLLKIHGLPFDPKSCFIDEKEISIKTDKIVKKVFEVQVPTTFNKIKFI